MNQTAVILLALVGVLAVVAGVAWMYPPAAVITAGVICVALAFIVEVRDS